MSKLNSLSNLVGAADAIDKLNNDSNGLSDLNTKAQIAAIAASTA